MKKAKLLTLIASTHEKTIALMSQEPKNAEESKALNLELEKVMENIKTISYEVTKEPDVIEVVTELKKVMFNLGLTDMAKDLEVGLGYAESYYKIAS